MHKEVNAIYIYMNCIVWVASESSIRSGYYCEQMMELNVVYIFCGLLCIQEHICVLHLEHKGRSTPGGKSYWVRRGCHCHWRLLRGAVPLRSHVRALNNKHCIGRHTYAIQIEVPLLWEVHSAIVLYDSLLAKLTGWIGRLASSTRKWLP